MTNEEVKELCIRLIVADTENEVVSSLTAAGLWDKPKYWRCYGDIENNYSQIGNQSSKPDAAIAEKIVNAIDSKLTSGCLKRGIDPESESAPQNMRNAVAQFYEDNPNSSTAGLIKHWDKEKRTAIAKNITVAATGYTPKQGNFCLTISDDGEGQTPQDIPNTFVSLTKSNKIRIPFVQGKFNQGGSAVLQFCGDKNLQLLVSRRNPELLKQPIQDSREKEWSFTVVRREVPRSNRHHTILNSVFKYLAPIGAEENPQKGEVLSFSADTLRIFPDGNEAYIRESKWGSMVKLYEYDMPGTQSHILRRSGLLRRLDVLLPSPALPIRLYECRKSYSGHEGSSETTLTGLLVRLGDDSQDNLECDPLTVSMKVAGQPLTIVIYVFKKDKAKSYKQNEGVLFTRNNQTHASLSTGFFKTKSVKLGYLADSLLVVVDCSDFAVDKREDFFMTSRDRLRSGSFGKTVLASIEEELRTNHVLRELTEKRRRELRDAKLSDSRPLEDVLQQILKKNPALSSLFLAGTRISSPFKPREVQEREERYIGEKYPTYFRFKGKEYSYVYERPCHINMRSRINFETDVTNDYFRREEEQGQSSLVVIQEDQEVPVDYYSLNLQNGIATLNVKLPFFAKVGDSISFICRVWDCTSIEPFENSFVLNIMEADQIAKGGSKRVHPPSNTDGKGRTIPDRFDLPSITDVTEEDWADHSFDQFSALRAVNLNTDSNETIYDFYVNVDNIYLKNELVFSKEDPEIVRYKFKIAHVLLALSLLQQNQQHNTRTPEPDQESDIESQKASIENQVSFFSRAISPFLLPMINALGGLNLEDISGNGDTVEVI